MGGSPGLGVAQLVVAISGIWFRMDFNGMMCRRMPAPLSVAEHLTLRQDLWIPIAKSGGGQMQSAILSDAPASDMRLRGYFERDNAPQDIRALWHDQTTRPCGRNRTSYELLVPNESIYLWWPYLKNRGWSSACSRGCKGGKRAHC